MFHVKSFGVKIILLFLLLVPIVWIFTSNPQEEVKVGAVEVEEKAYWFNLDRGEGVEYLYLGIPGETNKSELIQKFSVKTGASWSPTPLPELVGREYWLIVGKESSENPETAPYFLQLDVPVEDEWPYGPVPYTECEDTLTGESIQCDWVLPGYFGLHGVSGNQSKLSDDDFGSSGCVRHTDEDITYLYNLLDPENNEIRYYVEE